MAFFRNFHFSVQSCSKQAWISETKLLSVPFYHASVHTVNGKCNLPTCKANLCLHVWSHRTNIFWKCTCLGPATGGHTVVGTTVQPGTNPWKDGNGISALIFSSCTKILQLAKVSAILKLVISLREKLTNKQTTTKKPYTVYITGWFFSQAEYIIQETSFLHQEGWKLKLGQLQIAQYKSSFKCLT